MTGGRPLNWMLLRSDFNKIMSVVIKNMDRLVESIFPY